MRGAATSVLFYCRRWLLEFVSLLPWGHDKFPHESRQETASTPNLTHPKYPVTPETAQRSLYN
ncbi:hypothetical protein J6590_080203 [Homalodisca vitripennis]|nr:hypothetical protein J6590_080203 [Homalodisca vitripennis]